MLADIQKPGNHPNFAKKGSRSEKAILGATLGIPGYSRSNSRDGTHGPIYVKTLFSEQLSERLSEFVGRQNSAQILGALFSKLGWFPRARDMVFEMELPSQELSIRQCLGQERGWQQGRRGFGAWTECVGHSSADGGTVDQLTPPCTCVKVEPFVLLAFFLPRSFLYLSREYWTLAVFEDLRFSANVCVWGSVVRTYKALSKLGNGRNTVLRVLFRKIELTEFCAKLGEFLSPELDEGPKKLTELGV